MPSAVEKSDSGCKVVDDEADVVQSLDRHVPSMAAAMGAGPSRPFVCFLGSLRDGFVKRTSWAKGLKRSPTSAYRCLALRFAESVMVA
jgi:hypothetical protein